MAQANLSQKALSPAPEKFDLINEHTLADEIDFSVETLRTWRIRGGGPPFYKIRRIVKYSRAEVAEWLAGCRRRSTSEAAP